MASQVGLRSCLRKTGGVYKKGAVSFGVDEVRLFTHEVPMTSLKGNQAGSHCEKLHFNFDLEEGHLNGGNNALEANMTEVKEFVDHLQELSREKWVRPLQFLYKGETVLMTDGWKGKETRMNAWVFLGKVATQSGRREMDTKVIHRRSSSVKALLLRCPRTLDYEHYTNCVVDYIYQHLSPEVRIKTNEEWFKARDMRKKTSRLKPRL
eukprot:CAMPEP_0184486808 /NCGR_PEP_ID=MMETSP0113_2-20130426/8696_1 /TAXON_ID=91329 /ORGANISM="Norrisiella sphaerica, Strain BC52" /LENGTH=207 /DNA_ID=CAMNT_0026868859 /DNA_START=180 /DNA_END=803 /DNA_ORIENTATION=+